LENDFIEIVGKKKLPGRPALYGTTKFFLEYFGLKSLEDLPPLEELKKLSE
jgi:segregation and condensation protein B